MSELSTLRIWLSGPLQSWGVASRFDVRGSERAPSKSGVLGLLCAALGRRRDEPLDDLARWRFGVGVERPGTVLRDYHTAGAGTDEVVAADRTSRRGVVSERYYLEDAAFVVGLEGEDPVLAERLRDALLAPRWILSLGRRSCPPAGPLVDAGSIFPGSLEDALREGWHPEGAAFGAARTAHVELLVETADGPIVLEDQPVGAAYADRTFASRRLRRLTVSREPAP